VLGRSEHWKRQGTREQVDVLGAIHAFNPNFVDVVMLQDVFTT
jgi:hypothetical protein